MSSRAFFGPPQRGPTEGGLQVSVHLVPVHEGRLVAFDVRSAQLRGRWLPWAVIDFRQNPYEAAALLADDWFGDTALSDLRVADVLSLDGPLGGWEVAIVFRAELEAMPAGDPERMPYVYEAGAFDAIGAFDPVDLERWTSMPAAPVAATPPAEVTPPVPPAIF
jgi:hypothetical protein